MSESLGDNLDRATDGLRDKKDKTLSKEQVFFQLSRTLNVHNSRIDTLSHIQPEQKEKLKIDIKVFLLQSIQNTLLEKTKINGKDTNVIAEYNASSVDTDREPGLDSHEFARYMANLEEALNLIVELGGVDKFRKEMSVLHKDAYETTTISKMDLFGDRDEKSPMTRKFTEWYSKNVSHFTPEQIKDFTSTEFRGDKMKFIAGLSITLGTELGPEAIEIAVNFVYDLGKAIMQFPEYMYFGYQFNRATTEVGKKEYSLKMKSRLDDNMALGLLALAYDGTADVTQNLFGANISADAKGSRMKELIHSMGSPDTWTPAGIKEGVIGIAPFLPKLARMVKRGIAGGDAGESTRFTPPPNPNQERGGPRSESPNKPKPNIAPNPPLSNNPDTTKNTPNKPSPKPAPNIPQNQPQNQQNSPSSNLPGQPLTTAGAVASENIHRINSGDISLDNPQTAPLAEKMASPETNVVKERKLPNGETVKFETKAYLEAYKEGLEKVGELLQNTKDWVLMSSNAMYVNIKEYRMLPDDFDVVIRDKDFANIYEGLQQAQSEGKIRGLELHSIDKAHKEHVVDPAIQQQLLQSGNLKIVFNIDTENGIPMEVEMFAEGKGKGLTQLGNIPRTIESFMLNGKEIKVSGVFDLADTYSINLMDELLKNSVDKFGEKAKDGARIYNLTHYLQKTGINQPRDLITKMDEVVDKYRKHAGNELAPGLEAIFARLPEVKEILGEIIKDYEKQQKVGDKMKNALPEFQEFTETWNRGKGELHKLFVEASGGEKLSPERIQEIQNILDGYLKKTQSTMNRSLNNEDFAYFYEMSIIRMKYIQTIKKKLSNNQNNN
ncbi:MAG: hypothetical protein PHH70_00675 [Candidatus Gracilibacteria bacterium]|nr:hypothetical protein [Candidatus Gracilibacteria bacterium]